MEIECVELIWIIKDGNLFSVCLSYITFYIYVAVGPLYSPLRPPGYASPTHSVLFRPSQHFVPILRPICSPIVSLCVCLSVCVCVCLFMSVCMCVCLSLWVYESMSVYMCMCSAGRWVWARGWWSYTFYHCSCEYTSLSV